MIYLSYTGSTAVTVTLYELCQNQTNPYFTWKFIDKDSNDEYIFCADDFSTAPYYWNTFTISIATPSSATAGVIDIPAGQYTYEVYEMANQWDLNLNNAIGLVETGLVTINPTYSQIQSYTASPTTTNVYKNLNRI
jgi:ABC-type molybdate transport system substrate-binding protein